MSSNVEKFKALHAGSELFILPNAWDARSALIFQESGFKAIGTSSAAVANSLGYEDGEKMSFEDYLFVIKKILRAITVPLTVDIEMGYGNNDDQIADNVLLLAGLGVSGINIEDSFFDKNERKLKDPSSVARTIDYLKTKLNAANLNLFINLRSDAHILNIADKQAETLRRLKIYNTSRADGIFVPCIAEPKDIAEVVSNTNLPLNVMVLPVLPDIDNLQSLGVKRVSMGPFAFQKVYKGVGSLSKAIITSNSMSSLFN